MELANQLQSEESEKILLVDVCSHGYYDSGAVRIKGSIRIGVTTLWHVAEDRLELSSGTSILALESVMMRRGLNWLALFCAYARMCTRIRNSQSRHNTGRC
jgi:hypothetical protein